TVLLVVDSPVDSELTPLCAVLMPEEADVESEVSELFVLLRPVDSEATLLLVVLSPLEREVIELVADERPGRGGGRQRREIAVGGTQAGGQRTDAGRGRRGQRSNRAIG
ncbi:hypothetical protein, partial [Burkholderia pseudomallei]|uniref:hypothetical protein n=1 Tax=Burkholderia pseudomallei TaxID=28450 RepID=UPI002741D0D1